MAMTFLLRFDAVEITPPPEAVPAEEDHMEEGEEEEEGDE